MSKRMRTRWKWLFWGMRVASPCGSGRLCGPRRPPRRPLRGGWSASSRASGWGWVARGPRPRSGGPVGRSGRQRWAGEARGCGLRLPGFRSARLLQCLEACASASAGGEKFAWAALWGLGGWGLWFLGVPAGGLCGSLGGVGVPWGVGLFAVGVCELPGVGGGEAHFAGGSVGGLIG